MSPHPPTLTPSLPTLSHLTSPLLLRDWRRAFHDPGLYFYFVLLAGYKEGGDIAWPLIRDAQLAGLQEPRVRVATAQDLGDEASMAGGIKAIHSRNKTLVGERLAGLALADLYGRGGGEGPEVSDVVWPMRGEGVVVMRYKGGEGRNEGLRLLDTSECDLCCGEVEGSAVVLVGSDGVGRRAKVTVYAEAFVVVASVELEEGVEVVGVQLNWEAYPQCSLYNAELLPQLPLNIKRYAAESE